MDECRELDERASHIVVGYDDTSTSRRALAWSYGQARRAGARLVVAWVDPGQPLAVFVPAHAVALPTDHATAAERIAVHLQREGRDVDVQVVTRVGEAARELEQLADELRADLLVVGRSRIPARHILGSVATRLVRNAKQPVVVVP